MSAYRNERDREGRGVTDVTELSIAMIGPLFADRTGKAVDQMWDWHGDDDVDEKMAALILDLQRQAFKEGRAIAEAEMRRAGKAVTA